MANKKIGVLVTEDIYRLISELEDDTGLNISDIINKSIEWYKNNKNNPTTATLVSNNIYIRVEVIIDDILDSWLEEISKKFDITKMIFIRICLNEWLNIMVKNVNGTLYIRK